jgi:hypothetical protein
VDDEKGRVIAKRARRGVGGHPERGREDRRLDADRRRQERIVHVTRGSRGRRGHRRRCTVRHVAPRHEGEKRESGRISGRVGRQELDRRQVDSFRHARGRHARGIPEIFAPVETDGKVGLDRYRRMSH